MQYDLKNTDYCIKNDILFGYIKFNVSIMHHVTINALIIYVNAFTIK